MASKIEYLDKTWNPIAMRCTPVSPACDHCWHLSMAKRLAANKSIVLGRSAYAGGDTLITSRIADPLHWSKPQRVGVQFMGDLFHDSVPDKFIERVWKIMARVQRHTFLILTKRPRRMLNIVSRMTFSRELGQYTLTGREQINPPYLPNAWLGVTVEDQQRADERIPILLQIPAVKRFVSYEPALGPIDFSSYFHCQGCGYTAKDKREQMDHHLCKNQTATLGWVICGGESGPNARPSHFDWFRSVRDQCGAAGVPFFHKHNGEWISMYDRDVDDPDWRCCPKAKSNFERYVNLAGGHGFHGDRVVFMRRVGKKAAGSLLDGKEWKEFPK